MRGAIQVCWEERLVGRGELVVGRGDLDISDVDEVIVMSGTLGTEFTRSFVRIVQSGQNTLVE